MTDNYLFKKLMILIYLFYKFAGVGNGNPFQHYFLENLMDRGAMGMQRVRHDWTHEHTHFYKAL